MHHLRSFVHQVLANGKGGAFDRAHQRRGFGDRLGIDRCTGFDTRLDHIEDTAMRSVMKRSPFEIIRLIDISSVNERRIERRRDQLQSGAFRLTRR